MDFFASLIDIFLHIDEYLGEIVRNFGAWTYVILFLVIFAETGLVVTPFLPGDSLLFAAGAIAALVPDTLNIGVLIIVLIAAAILGDTVNYWIGHWVGPKAFSGKVRFLKKEHLDRTNACLLYTSDAADERSSVDLGGRRIIKKKKQISE